MGTAVSHLKHVVDEIYTHQQANPVTPPNEDGACVDVNSRAVTPIGRVLHFDEKIYTDICDLYEDFRSAWTGSGMDDRHMLLEKVLVWMAQHQHRPIEHKLESIIVDFLYKDLPHPPAGYISLPGDMCAGAQKQHKAVTYAFRAADGADYNVLWPGLGKAGSPYARSVPSTHPLPAFALPDAGLVFDRLLKRETFTPHPDGVSSLFFAFADLIIHTIFNTNRQDPTVNDASSYLDLSPLYGNSDTDVDSIRRKDGTGRLFDDVFADSRLLAMPPSVCALLVLMCRNHNYIAEKILAINERNTYHAPDKLSDADRHSQDEELFQRARLVNCGFFMQIILGDYVGAILGLVRDGYSWRLKILDSYRTVEHDVAPRGEGNVVSVEFNLMYRWHAAISAQDTQWAENRLRQLFPGKDLSKLTKEDFKGAYRTLRPPADRKAWTFGDLKRGQNGRFNDADLAKILQDATDADAGAFGARGIPEAMKVIELMAIEQARNWGTCSLNEFRRFMGLKPYASFSEWNPDEDIARTAEMLYHDVENLELYVGMIAEQTKEPGPGAGLCPGYTLSRAILSDAVCLTRGDRFMTTEFTPQNFTAWGYKDCQFDTADGSYGGMLTKLLFRHLPAAYPARSAYAHFPFLVPRRFEGKMRARDGALAAQYTWTRPPVPSAAAGPERPLAIARGKEVYEERVRALTGCEAARPEELERLLFSTAALASHGRSFARFTDAQLRARSLGSGTKYVDIVRDVINMVPVYWIAAVIKPRAVTPGCAGKEYRPEKYFADFANLADYVYINTAPEREFALHSAAAQAAASILCHIDDAGVDARTDVICSVARELSALLRAASPAPPPADLAAFLADPPCASPDDAACLEAMRFAADSAGLAAAFVGQLAATAAVYARAVARLVDSLLDGEGALVEKIRRGVGKGEDARFVDEVHAAVATVDDIGISHGLMDKRFIEATVPEILRCIFTLPYVRRTAGMSGKLHSLAEAGDATGQSGVKTAVYLNAQGDVTPWPTSMTLQYSQA